MRQFFLPLVLLALFLFLFACFVFYLNLRTKHKNKIGLRNVDSKKKNLKKLEKIFVVVIITTLLSNMAVEIVKAVDYYNFWKDLYYEESYVEINKSDEALGIKQTTEESTTTTTIETTTEATTVETTTEATTEATTKETTEATIKPTSIPFDVNNPPKYKITEVMLFGIDARTDNIGYYTENGGKLSDVIKPIAINQTLNVIGVASPQRDMNVSDTGVVKLNSWFSYYGAAKALSKFNTYFETDIRDFIVVDFYAFVEIIDAIGGVEIDVKEKDRNEINKCIEYQCGLFGLNYSLYKIEKSGLQLLNGNKALGLSRARKQDSDWERSKRQDQVIGVALKKIKVLSKDELESLIKKLLPRIRSTLEFDTFRDLALDYILSGGYSMETQLFPASSYKEGIFEVGDIKSWFIKFDKKVMIKELNEFLKYNIKP